MVVILDLKVFGKVFKKIVRNIKHQKDAQRISLQKEVLNSSPSCFSGLFVKTVLFVQKRFSVVPCT